MYSHQNPKYPQVNSKPFFLAEAAVSFLLMENSSRAFLGRKSFWHGILRLARCRLWVVLPKIFQVAPRHGERSVFPAQWQWRPQFKPGKISVIKVRRMLVRDVSSWHFQLTPTSDPAQRYRLKELYRASLNLDQSILHYIISARCLLVQRWFHCG